MNFVVARNPDPDSRLPYLVRLPIDGQRDPVGLGTGGQKAVERRRLEHVVGHGQDEVSVDAGARRQHRHAVIGVVVRVEHERHIEAVAPARGEVLLDLRRPKPQHEHEAGQAPVDEGLDHSIEQRPTADGVQGLGYPHLPGHEAVAVARRQDHYLGVAVRTLKHCRSRRCAVGSLSRPNPLLLPIRRRWKSADHVIILDVTRPRGRSGPPCELLVSRRGPVLR